MPKVIIGFSRPIKKKIFSNLIMFFEKTNFSHVYIKINSTKYNRELIYQASGLTVNFIGSKSFNENHISVYEFELEISNENYIKMMQFAIDNTGVPYGFKQLIGIGIYKLGKWLGTNWNNPFRDGKNTYVCSELVATIIKNYSSLDINGDLDNIDPKYLYELISNLK